MAETTEAASEKSGLSWDRLQSVWLLPAARRIYIIGAFIAVAVALIALIGALAFHVATIASAPQHTVPHEKLVSVAPFEPGSADVLVTPPSNIRVTTERLVAPVVAGELIGRFSADSPHQVRVFDIVGGLSAELVQQGDGGSLFVTAEMARRLAGIDPNLPKDPLISLRVFATDALGNASAPRNLNFRLDYVAPRGPVAPQAQPQSQDQIEEIPGPAALRPTAALLAGRVADSGAPEYWDAYQAAMALPARCGADGNEIFVNSYIGAAARAAPRLHSENLAGFFRGLCDLWNGQLAKAAAASREANTAREALIMRNAEAEIRSHQERAEAATMRNTAFGVAGSAMAFFMVIALFLAFMAIEGHSKALRDALQAMARGRADHA